MTIPTRYLELISGLPETEVGFGAGGIHLFARDELDKSQVGYSIDSDGFSICGKAKGEWKSSWLVIGHDIGVGDPIFIDTSDPKLVVLTAAHGEGAWDAKPIAISIEAFCKIFLELTQIANGRTNPVEAENNPVTLPEQDAFLSLVAKINEDEIEPDFWNDMFAYVCD